MSDDEDFLADEMGVEAAQALVRGIQDERRALGRDRTAALDPWRVRFHEDLEGLADPLVMGVLEAVLGYVPDHLWLKVLATDPEVFAPDPASAATRREAEARDLGARRWSQACRISDARFPLSAPEHDELLGEALRVPLGRLHMGVWFRAMQELREELMGTDHDAWVIQRDGATMLNPAPDDQVAPYRDEELCGDDRFVDTRMTLCREAAVDVVRGCLEAEGSADVIRRENVQPNPYRDLWVIDPTHASGEMRCGGSAFVVRADGSTYEFGGPPPWPAELIGVVDSLS